MSKTTSVLARKPLRIGIDGPAGAGKSTLARRLAARLGVPYIDTGAMYRALTLKVLRLGVDPGDRDAVALVAASSQVSLTQQGGDAGQGVTLDGEDVSGQIRSPAVNASVSRVAENPAVRRIMVEAQREMARGGAIMEGRDICTRVLPDAELKLFLTASLPERARRRWSELTGKGYAGSLQEVEAAIAARDRLDSARDADPLRPAEGAVVMDSTFMDADEVARAAMRLCEGLGLCSTGC